MERITVTDVRRAFAAHVDALQRCGITYEGRLVLSEGSASNGIAYRLNIVDGGHSRPPIGDDYLGKTAAQAYTSLHDRTQHAYDTVQALKNSRVTA